MLQDNHARTVKEKLCILTDDNKLVYYSSETVTSFSCYIHFFVVVQKMSRKGVSRKGDFNLL